jgi:RNA polymerase sigma factor (sigma-70 family)
MHASTLHPSSAELEAIRSGNHADFATLLGRWLCVIIPLAWKFGRSKFASDDYLQVASLALLRTCVKSPALGAKFEQRARRTIKCRMIDLARRERQPDNDPVRFVDPDELAEPEADADLADPHIRLVQEEDCERLGRWMSQLPERERRLLKMKYWEGASQAVVARELGLTEARVSQLHSALLKDAEEFLAE